MSKASNLLHTVIQKATENIASFLASLALSTGLVGGSTYFFFGLGDDLHRRRLARIEIEKRLAVGQSDMMLIHSWGLPEHQHAQTIINLLQQVSQHTAVSQLELPYARQLWSQAQHVIVDLTKLRGEIKGYSFPDQNRTRYQQTFIEALDLQIGMVGALRDLVQGWESFSAEEREKRLRSVEEKTLPQLEKQAQHTTAIQRVMTTHQEKMKEDEKQEADIAKAIADTKLKQGLSVLGIVAGVMLLLAFFIRASSGGVESGFDI